MKIKIISKGTAFTTQVVNAETGEPIEGITAIKWEVDTECLAQANVTFVNVPVEVVGEVTDENDPKPVGPPNTLLKEWELPNAG